MKNKEDKGFKVVNSNLIETSKRFNMKQIKKLKLLVLFRLIEKLDKIDNDEIFHLTASLNEKLKVLDIKNRSNLKDFRIEYKLLLNVIIKEYPNIAKSVISNKGVIIASTSTLGSTSSSVSAGAMGAGVAVAASLNYDDVYLKKDE